ncbi:hypothetical protein [Zunongwangia sp. H14]|uniref:hypothetical protein n=1 Tax=Zunongwangia sp. H14 TaxID=3240792 RepID=UPI003561B849
MYETAPILFMVASLLAIRVLPFSESAVLARIGTGVLFINAALAYMMVALLISDWALKVIYRMIEGLRFWGSSSLTPCLL